MTQDDSEWVNGLFAAIAGDWTPAPASHVARVLYAPVSRDPEASRRCVSVLSDIELQRADRFVTEDGKAHFKQRRAFRRYCGAFVLGSPQPLSRIVFQETEKGLPTFPICQMSGLVFLTCLCRIPPVEVRVRPSEGRTDEASQVYGRADYRRFAGT